MPNNNDVNKHLLGHLQVSLSYAEWGYWNLQAKEQCINERFREASKKGFQFFKWGFW